MSAHTEALATVDIAGTAWPTFKLEALALGLLVFVATLTLSLETAVLAGAAISVVAWFVLPAAQRDHRTMRD